MFIDVPRLQCSFIFLSLDLMMRMGFSADEIKDSLLNNKYDEVMATYLLLDEKRVSAFNLLNFPVL